MKGIVFTEFLDLVESKFGLEMVDKIISQSDLSSNGAYTRVGTYSFFEMLQLLQNLSKNTNISINDLLLTYGEHFFSVLEANYSDLLKIYKDPLDMLASIENHIHVEVRKIYPDAELPTFTVIEKADKQLVLVYESNRAMYAFGLGLMRKTFEYFNEKATIEMDMVKKDGTKVKFIINKN